MGCGGSKLEEHQQPPREIRIGAPQDVQIQIPRNRANQHGVPLQQVTRDVDRDTLFAALNHVSNFLAQRRKHISVVAAGGAVNALYLQSRLTTHDVDVFGSDVNNDARIVLDEAMQDAIRSFPGLGTDWLNTETQMWMPGPLHKELTTAARQQNVKVFDGAGLTIYAAPWAYAFCAKIDRIMKGPTRARPYDLPDAVTYIHEYIQGHGRRPVPIANALGWAHHFRHQMSEEILRNHVDREYRLRYGRPAFV